MKPRSPSRIARVQSASRAGPGRAAQRRTEVDDTAFSAADALAVTSDEEARRLLDLRRELSTPGSEHTRRDAREKLRRELRKKRLVARRAEQRLSKLAREQARAARREEHRRTQRDTIGYLGRDVSRGLSARTGDEARLSAQGLPSLPTPEAVAQALGITPGALRWLCYQRTVTGTTHYVRFEVPKKTGGTRLICAPMPRLKRAQRWILDHVLEPVAVSHAAHGFRPGRSIVSNARPHVGAGVVVNLDLQDFFPSIVFRRVKGLFVALGYAEATATVLALLSTEPVRTEVQLDGERLYVAEGPRRLPQGAPTSPALTNLLCRRLDRRLTGAARRHELVYTRYADDLTFSGGAQTDVGALLRDVHRIVEAEGFVVHPDKTRVLRKGRQQEVTGIVVNERMAVDRKLLRRFRALLHQIEQTGPEGKRWGQGGHVLAAARGFASFVAMVDVHKGRALLAQVAALEARYGAPDSREQRLAGVRAEGLATLDVAAHETEPAAPSVSEVEQVVSVKRWWKR